MTLLDRLRAAMATTPQARAGYGSDDEISGHFDAPRGDLTPAAVLMAVTLAAEPMLLLTKRTDTLRRHAGQVAFPGGRIDPGDASPTAAALREADEEVALAPHHVEVLGALDRYETGTGFSITPIVGLIPAGLVLTPHEREVAEVFEAPLAHVLDPANHELRQSEWQGRTRRYYVIRHDRHDIWGATAGMIVNLARRLL